MPVQNVICQVSRGVGHHRNRPPVGVGQLPVLGPHVVGLGRLDGSPAGGIGKDGLRGIGVHMDLENVSGHQDRATPERPHGRADLIGRGHLLPPDQDLGAVLEVTLGGHFRQKAAGLLNSPRGIRRGWGRPR